MPRTRNRRARTGANRRRAAGGPRKRRTRSKNRKGAPKRRSRARAAERKHRNRTILLMALLALVNVYVFLGDGGPLSNLGQLPDAVVRSGGALPAHAEPPKRACSGHPVRVFAGLEDLIMFESDLSQGKTLRLALLQSGVEGDQIDLLESAIHAKVDLGLVSGSGAPLRAAVDRHGRIHAVEIELAEGHVVQACRGERGYEVRNIQHPLRTDVVVIGVELDRHADVEAALTAAGETPELVDKVSRALAYDIDLRVEARPADRLQVMVEKRWLGRHFHRYGDILAVRYIGAEARVVYYRYKPEGMDTDMFDRGGDTAHRTLLRSPVSWHPVNAEARGLLEPKVEVVQGRQGVVYRLPEGAPIVALADGTVQAVAEGGQLGRLLEIEHEDGLVSRYGHLDRIIGGLEVGSEVRAGQLVALAGHSGKTPTDRLRLELWREHGADIEVLDPMLLTSKGDDRPRLVGPKIPEALFEQFRRAIRPWHQALRKAE